MKQWSMRQMLFCLIGSTCLTLFFSIGGYWIWKNHRQKLTQSSAYAITTIIQTGLEKEVLKTDYLAELLGLYADQPTNLYTFDCKKGQKQLLSCPLIASAELKRMAPSTLYVDYEVYKPIAWLSDYKNTAVDAQGHFFPVAPFFSPKHLPEIYLGIPAEEVWRVQGPSFDLALEILQFLDAAPWKEGLRVKRIDVSNAFAPSLGQREVVLITEEEIVRMVGSQEIVYTFPKILRLAPKDYPQQLGNFFSLRRSMMEDYLRQIATFKQGGRFSPRIIDLRIPQLAFVER